MAQIVCAGFAQCRLWRCRTRALQRAVKAAKRLAHHRERAWVRASLARGTEPVPRAPESGWTIW